MKLSPPTRPSEALASRGAPLVGAPGGRGRGAKRTLGMRNWFLLLVLLPTLAVGVYFYGFAANIYESEARFVVRNRGSGQANPIADMAAGASRMASLFPSARTGGEEGRAVVAYVDSHAAVAALRVANARPLIYELDAATLAPLRPPRYLDENEAAEARGARGGAATMPAISCRRSLRASLPLGRARSSPWV